VIVVMVVLLIPGLVAATVSSRVEENEMLRSAIDRIHSARDRIGRREADRARVDAKYARAAPPLAGYLDKVANSVGIDIPESQDRASVPHGKKFEERSTKLTLKKVGMLAFVNFLDKIENSGFPIRVSNMTIRKRGVEDDSYDINLIVSAFDREEPKKEEPPSEDEEAE
jgi:general secretion pathway protein M